MSTQMPDLVGLFEIAQLASVSVQAVSNWTTRKASFPKPIAVLASGPIWDGQSIRDWLRRERGTPYNSTKDGNMASHKLTIGSEYTLTEVQMLIGGDSVSYLPQTAGRIVGARFMKGGMNPNAPYEVLVGDRPIVKRKAELLAVQGGSIPVFMKQGTNRWLYHGPMRFVSYRTDLPAIEAALPGSARDHEVVGVLTFADAA